MIRFTVWLSNEERDKLREVAEDYGSSQNYIARVLLREGLGLGKPKNEKPERINMHKHA